MIKVIELFAGIECQREALKRANIEHEVVVISENDKYASRAYESLHGKVNNLGDIKKIEKLPKADLWTYSFPCTDISLAGKMRGFDKDSNPGIIPKEEWDMVQLELQRRTKLRYSYSSKNCFSSKLICADCGHLYGSKVWHSTDKYKKTIWQCNYKFDKKNKEQCQTPTLNEEEIKAMFVDAYNKMIVSKDEILKNLELVLNQIVSVESIEDKIKEVNKDIESVVYDVEILIHSSKETDEIKQKELELKYDKLIQKLKDLEHQKEKVMDKRNKINTFISTLKDKVDVISEFDEELFNIMVDKAVVHRDKSIEFIFNLGYKVKVEARK